MADVRVVRLVGYPLALFSHFKSGRACGDLPLLLSPLRLSSRRPGGDAGKRLVIFNLHTAVTASSRLSADVIRAWGPLWPPGVWEDFSRSGGSTSTVRVV